MAGGWSSGRGISVAYLASALLLVALGRLYLAAATDAGTSYFPPWKLDQYAFSYQDLGFAKRALIGTLLDLVLPEPGRAAAKAVMVAVAALLAGCLACLARRHADPFLAFALLISPATFLNIGCDLGRQDQLNLLLLLAILFAPGRGWILLAPVMVLIHEPAAVLFLPLAFYGAWAAHGWSRVLLASGALSLLALLAVMAAGTREPEVLRALYPELRPESLDILTRSIGENIAFVAGQLRGTEGVLFLGYLAALFYLAVILGIVRARVRALPSASLGLLAALAPLALSLVGIDVARWIALAATNLFLLALFAVSRGEAPTPESPGAPLHILLVLYALGGPMGIVFAFEGALEAWVRL